MKILAIDDDRDSLESLAESLGMAGYDVTACVDPELGLDTFRSESFDAVITDYKMPRINGIDVLKAVKETDPSAHVLIVTGFAETVSAVDAVNNKAYGYFRKPLDIGRLIAALENIGKEIETREREMLRIEESERMGRDLELTYEELQAHVVLIDQVQSLGRKIHSASSLGDIISELVNGVRHLLGCELSLISFEDIHRSDCHLSHSEELADSEALRCLPLEKLDSRLGRGIEIIENSPGASIREKLRQRGMNLRNYISVPLKHDGEYLGYLAAFNKQGGFNGTDKHLLYAISGTAVTAIYNSRLILELKELFQKTVETLSRAIEARDHYTSGHINRVTGFTLAIARRLGWNEEQLKNAHIGTMLHDIGKIGIPDAILNKRGPLTADEFNMMKKHVDIGVKIIEGIPNLEGVISFVRYHHERYDGGGYPAGLSGAGIPVEGRVITVADSFDAMTSDRPYRSALSVDDALDELRDKAGTQFDPEVVELFAGMVRAGKLDEIIYANDETDEKELAVGDSGLTGDAATGKAAGM